MQTINEDIKNGTFRRVYLLYGDEDYLKLQYKNKLLRALVTEGDTMNFSRFEGKEAQVPALIDLAETMPFFAEHRVILVEDSGFFKNAAPQLAEYLPDYFDMLLLASTSELESAPHDIVTLTYPIRPNDLVSTVEMMLTQLDRRLKKRKSQPKKRTEQEQNYINNAKWLLMERNHMTEQEAFRYIQKSSMDSGTNMVETAQMILLLIYDG